MKNTIKFIFFLFIISLYPKHLFSENYIPTPECGINILKKIEEKFKNISPHQLTRKELIKRGRISYSGNMVYDTVGQKKSFWNILTVNSNLNWQKTSATCKMVSDNMYIYIADKVFYDENTSPAGYMTQKDIDEIIKRISTDSTNIYKYTREVFGEEKEKGVDEDNHLTIFFLDINNDWDSSNTTWLTKGWIGGYSTIIDSYSNADLVDIKYSNERKIIYIDTYPTFEHGKVFFEYDSVKIKSSTPTTNHEDDEQKINFPEGPKAVYPTFAHEFQHKIHENYDINEENWLNEGCSELSEVVNGLGPTISHIRNIFENSNDNLIDWQDTQRDYGASLLFFTYLYDHFDKNDFIKNLVKNKERGINSININLFDHGYTKDNFDEIFSRWIIANYFNDSTSIGLDYAYRSINLFETTFFKTTPKEPNIIRYGMNPAARKKSENSFSFTNTIYGRAGIYYSFVPTFNTTNLKISFTGDENESLWDTKIGIINNYDSLKLQYFPIYQNKGNISISNFSSTQIKELVFIITNKGNESKKFTFYTSQSFNNSPFSPINITTVAGDGKVELTWDSNEESAYYESTFINSSKYTIKYFAGYNVYRWTNQDKNLIRLNSIVIEMPGYIDTNVTGNVYYYYNISAIIADLTITNNKVSNQEIKESPLSYTVYSNPYPPLTRKVKSKCLITNSIPNKYIKNFIQIRDKYLYQNFISKKLIKLYYTRQGPKFAVFR